MKISFLYKFLNEDILVEQFKNYIAKDAESHKRKLQKERASIILPIEDDYHFYACYRILTRIL